MKEGEKIGTEQGTLIGGCIGAGAVIATAAAVLVIGTVSIPVVAIMAAGGVVIGYLIGHKLGEEFGGTVGGVIGCYLTKKRVISITISESERRLFLARQENRTIIGKTRGAV